MMSSPVLLAVGLVLWFFPLWIWRAPRSRLGGFDQREWPSGRNLALTVVDALRSAAGAAAVARGVAGALAGRDLPGITGEAALAALFILALGWQALSWRTEDFLHSPVAFLLGALTVLLHPVVLAISLPLALGSAFAVRGWSAYFLGAALGVAGVGAYLPMQDWRRAILVGAAATAPVVASLLAGRHLGGPRRQAEKPSALR